jgi:hypothetical protein
MYSILLRSAGSIARVAAALPFCMRHPRGELPRRHEPRLGDFGGRVQRLGSMARRLRAQGPAISTMEITGGRGS